MLLWYENIQLSALKYKIPKFEQVEPPAPTPTSHSKRQERARPSTASNVAEAAESKAARGWLTTCPRAWWERGSSKEGQREEELPTRQSVVQMGENELRKTREAVARYASTKKKMRYWYEKHRY